MTPQNKRILAFILGLCIIAIGALLVSKEIAFDVFVGAGSVAFGLILITLSALKEEHWR